MSRWPFPADSALDRARRMCATYREAARSAGADTAPLDAHFSRLGETWVGGVDHSDDDDLVTAAEAQDRLGIPASTVRNWGARAVVEPVESDAGRVYRVGDLRAAQAGIRRRRASRRVVDPGPRRMTH